MNIIDFLKAIEKPDGYLEKGYSEDEIWEMVKGREYFETTMLMNHLLYYAKVKMDPTDDVKEVKKRFEKECNDPWCMYTVLVPMQKDHYRGYRGSVVLRSALIELHEAREKGLGTDRLETLEYWYQKTRSVLETICL